jgi:hypothetical protein
MVGMGLGSYGCVQSNEKVGLFSRETQAKPRILFDMRPASFFMQSRSPTEYGFVVKFQNPIFGLIIEGPPDPALS